MVKSWRTIKKHESSFDKHCAKHLGKHIKNNPTSYPSDISELMLICGVTCDFQSVRNYQRFHAFLVRHRKMTDDKFIELVNTGWFEEYLNNVSYDEITRFSYSFSGSIIVEYTRHSGETVPIHPASQTFWTVSEHGAGIQILEWPPGIGSYWIVLMNEDGSANIDLTISLRVKIPLLFTIGLVLLVGAVFLLIIGGVMIYFGVRA